MAEVEWTDAEWWAAWGGIAETRDQAPRQPDDASSDDVTDAVLARLAPHIAAREAAAEKRGRVAALREAEGALDYACPHEPDEHAEGTCELCDWTFAIGVILQELADAEAGGGS